MRVRGLVSVSVVAAGAAAQRALAPRVCVPRMRCVVVAYRMCVLRGALRGWADGEGHRSIRRAPSALPALARLGDRLFLRQRAHVKRPHLIPKSSCCA